MLLESNNTTSEEKFFLKVPFTIASKTIKFLGINLTREVKDIQERKETNGKISCVHRAEEFILLISPYYLNSMQSLSKFQ